MFTLYVNYNHRMCKHFEELYMVTEYGKFLRKLRIDRGERLEDMAKNLGVSKTYLSLIENGYREATSKLSAGIAQIYALTPEQCGELAAAAAETPVKTVTIDMEPLRNNREAQSTAEYFSHLLPMLSEKQTRELDDFMHDMAVRYNFDRVCGDFS